MVGKIDQRTHHGIRGQEGNLTRQRTNKQSDWRSFDQGLYVVLNETCVLVERPILHLHFGTWYTVLCC
jgi:hypothetical protein